MTASQFIEKYQGYAVMTARCSVVVVETPDGIMLARAKSKHGPVAYSAHRTASKAVGRAASAAMSYSDLGAGDSEAFDTPDEAIAHFTTSPADYH